MPGEIHHDSSEFSLGGTVHREERPSPSIVDALLPLHAASNQRALADAIAALGADLEEDVAVCVFLDDGSGTLVPFLNSERPSSSVASIRLSTTQPGPLFEAFATGEIVVLDSLTDLVGEEVPEVPARRILLGGFA